MKVRLKVLSGGSKGKELKLKAGEFLIGRSDSCHLRPKSDAISRKHCVLFVDEKHVRVRDLKSRNGTLVNGEKIVEETELNLGDRLTVGPLDFEVLITKEEVVAKKPVKSAPAQPAAAPRSSSATAPTRQPTKRNAAGGGSVADDDIFGWLEEADEVDREARLTDPTTRQYRIGQSKKADAEEGEADGGGNDETVDMAKPDESGDTKAGKEKKEPGKLPPVPEKTTENSQEAAADALKMFFKRQ